MKKLMIALAAVAMAAGVQAGTVAWGAAIGIGEGMAQVPENSYAYLLYSSSAMELATTIAIAGNGADAIGGEASNGGKIVAFHQIDATESTNFSFLDSYSLADADGGVNGYYQLILANADNTLFAVNDPYTAHITGISDTSQAGDATFNASFDHNYVDTLGMNDFTGTIEGVPEPTSGLLLLLGVAGLALRRRRA